MIKSQNLEIREIQKSDNPILAKIIRSVFEEFSLPKIGTVYDDPTTDRLYELFRKPGAQGFVGLIEGVIIGCAGIYPTDNLPKGFCEFSKFYIINEARGKGMGKLLINTAITTAKQLGYKHIYLESFPGLDTALTLYDKLGFVTRDVPLGNSGHFACSVWKTLDIS
ncbi:MAG: hypothetical protein NVSMB45_17180 [Ginsengibacter sp.]